MYLALALSFAHVIVLGPSFVGHPLTRVVWSLAWAGTAGLVLAYRFGLPVVRSLRHRLVVAEVRPEGPGVVSVICSGRRLDELPVAGGQFMLWRFLTRGSWWQAHPYSLSALPQPPYLRLTVKAVGDHSASLASLRPGTPVMVEGPYGAFTRHAQVRPGAVLVAAGIGVTALRSLLEDLPRNSAPVVLLRASRPADLVLGQEVSELVRHRRGQLHTLVGDREQAGIDERVAAPARPRPAPPGRLRVRAGGVRGRHRRSRQAPRRAGRSHPSRGVRPLTTGSASMKRAAWYLAAGAVAGFAGVLGLHGRTAPAAPRAAGGAPGRSQPGPSAPSARPAPARPPAARRSRAGPRPAAGHTASPVPWSSSATASSPSGSP